MVTLMFGLAFMKASTCAFSESYSALGSSPAEAAAEDEEPPELPPHAATSSATAPATSAAAMRFDFQLVCCRGAIDAPFRDLRGVRSSQPTTHPATVGRGARSAVTARRRPARSW